MKKLLVLLVIAVLAAPAAALADANAVTTTTTKSDNSAKIDFNAKCAKCHRATKALPNTAKSLGVDPGKLVLRTSKMNREEMIAIIEKGKDKMPGFEKELTKEQITDVVDYIIFLKKKPTVRSGSSTRLVLILSGCFIIGIRGIESIWRRRAECRLKSPEGFFSGWQRLPESASRLPGGCRSGWKRPSGWGMCRRGLP